MPIRCRLKNQFPVMVTTTGNSVASYPIPDSNHREADYNVPLAMPLDVPPHKAHKQAEQEAEW
jgi:hypothetical protein